MKLFYWKPRLPIVEALSAVAKSFLHPTALLEVDENPVVSQASLVIYFPHCNKVVAGRKMEAGMDNQVPSLV